MTDYECKICRNVIPPDAKFCEHCETGFTVANEKWNQRYEMELDRQHDDSMRDLIDSENRYLGEKL